MANGNNEVGPPLLGTFLEQVFRKIETVYFMNTIFNWSWYVSKTQYSWGPINKVKKLLVCSTWEGSLC